MKFDWRANDLELHIKQIKKNKMSLLVAVQLSPINLNGDWIMVYDRDFPPFQHLWPHITHLANVSIAMCFQFVIEDESPCCFSFHCSLVKLRKSTRVGHCTYTMSGLLMATFVKFTVQHTLGSRIQF